MTDEKAVSAHYEHGNLLKTIEERLAALGKTSDDVTIEDLAPVDEFHVGGRPATEHFLNQLGFQPQDHVLDVGCGLGGPARYVARTFGSRVTGIDLTAEYIETGTALCHWVKLAERITLLHASALSMPFPDASFDGGYMMHVGMNIEDKAALYREIHRTLRPGATFGVYDVMRIGEGDLAYPVPWASEERTSHVAIPDSYRLALTEAGFEISAENNRREFARTFFQNLRARTEAAGGPPPLGLHILMKDTTALKIQNMIGNVESGLIAPIELIARKPENR